MCASRVKRIWRFCGAKVMFFGDVCNFAVFFSKILLCTGVFGYLYKWRMPRWLSANNGIKQERDEIVCFACLYGVAAGDVTNVRHNALALNYF